MDVGVQADRSIPGSWHFGGVISVIPPKASYNRPRPTYREWTSSPNIHGLYLI